jgi:hypothetical protein
MEIALGLLVLCIVIVANTLIRLALIMLARVWRPDIGKKGFLHAPRPWELTLLYFIPILLSGVVLRNMGFVKYGRFSGFMIPGLVYIAVWAIWHKMFKDWGE